MRYSEKFWHIFPDQPKLQLPLQRELHVSPILSKLLVNRNLTDPESARRFLFPTLQELRHPFLMKDIRKAAHRIIEAIHRHEKLCIFGDYDADGITGTAVLKLFLDSVGADATFYIPHRLNEGYGLTNKALDRLRRQEISLIITVDCGISNYDEVPHATRLGIDVIVTDHHEVPERIPPAYAVVNPKQKDCEFPFKHLAGVGIAFYLVIALRAILREEGFWKDGTSPNLSDYLDLVALGTIADIVPLREENRILVKYGTEVMNRSRRPGIVALKKVSRLEDYPITHDSIAYRMAPRINAAGRLDQANKGVILLTTPQHSEAEKIARELDAENLKRQQIEATIVREACGIIQDTDQWSEQKAFVLASPDWHPGVIGIGASRIVERYYRPTILISLDGEIGRGSARSIEDFSILTGLKECEDLLERFGGHQFAAGLIIAKEHIAALRERINSFIHENVSPEAFVPKLHVDTQVDLSQVNESVVEDIQAIAPFGTGNPEPLFVSGVLSACNPQVVGNSHLKMRLGNDGSSFEAIGFSLGNRIPQPNSPLRIAFTPEISTWQNVKSVRLRMKDLQLVSV